MVLRSALLCGAAVALWLLGSADGQAQPQGKKGKKANVVSDEVLALAYSPCGTTVACAGVGGDVKLWDVRTGQLRRTLSGPNRSTRRALAFTPDGTILAVGGEDRAVHLWNPLTGERLRTLGGKSGDELAHVSC